MSWVLSSRIRQSETISSIPPLNRKLMMKVREILRIIKADGWVQVRQTGSHRHFHHATKPGTVTVAGHPSAELAPKTASAIMKQAGLEKQQ
jgi:predicted RNA binding protein YcfA (HicA-like mRNA interferase family)